MHRYLFLPLALGAVACEAPPEPFSGDVFWIQITDDGTVCPDIEITHNFNAELSDTTSTFDVTREATESIGGEYAYVTRGEDGSIFLNFRNEVLTGTEQDNGAIEVSWINDESTTQSLNEPTFVSTLTQAQTVEQTMTLRPGADEENPTYSGTYSLREYQFISLDETDEWDFQALGIGTQFEDTDDFLTWIVPPDPPFNGSTNVRNRSFLDDCPESDVCEFRYEEDCTRQFTVDAIKLDGADINDFGAIGDFGQPNGVE